MPEDQTRVWTVRELMRSAIDHLQKQGFENARLNVELLLAHALDIKRIQIYLNFDKPVSPEDVKRFRLLYERRLKREPVQYIIGNANFMGLNFNVDPRVLIPRPETETLIEQVIMMYQNYPAGSEIRILDIGTGSGNISVALAKFIRNARITAVDSSFEALVVAQKNACVHAIESKINFKCMDIFEEADELPGNYDLIISNPPYISKDEWEQLQAEVKDFEPACALMDGKDGLEFYRKISGIIPVVLKPQGTVVLEIGFGQAEAVVGYMKDAGLRQIIVTKDLQGIPRVVAGIWPGSVDAFISPN
jgi:release factor glutamine methyltransferase